MNSHSSRVGAMSWNNHILTTGSRNGQLVHNDVRHREHIITIIQSHTQEVNTIQYNAKFLMNILLTLITFIILY
jgi:cell division cycle protein 20 (cofactor of APC complex)